MRTNNVRDSALRCGSCYPHIGRVKHRVDNQKINLILVCSQPLDQRIRKRKTPQRGTAEHLRSQIRVTRQTAELLARSTTIYRYRRTASGQSEGETVNCSRGSVRYGIARLKKCDMEGQDSSLSGAGRKPNRRTLPPIGSRLPASLRRYVGPQSIVRLKLATDPSILHFRR
jgi:hypothetical protein